MAYIKGRVNRDITVVEADADAEYEQTIEIDLSALKPTVACPHLPENTKTIDELGHIEIQQSVIGSCTNGRIDDMRVAAEILKAVMSTRTCAPSLFPPHRRFISSASRKVLPRSSFSGRDCFHPDLRPVSGRPYGHSGARRKVGFDHEP